MKNRLRKTGKKRTAAQWEKDLAFIEPLYCKNIPTREIARRLSAEREYSLSHTMIARDQQEILRRWRESIEDIGKHKAKALADLNHVQAEALEQWERSKLDGEKKIVKIDDSGKRSAESVTDRQCGDPRYLKIVEDAINARADILGFKAASKTDIRGFDGGPVKYKLILPIGLDLTERGDAEE